MDAVETPARHGIDGLHLTAPPVLLSYQQELCASVAKNALTVEEKSRRIGASWGLGSEAALTAAAKREAGGMDVLYIGYNLDMAREFIDYVGFWSRHFALAAAAVEETVFEDEDRDIKAYRVTFASGFEVLALSSKPRSLRARQGLVIIDEAAFHGDLAALLKAAFALLIWGGRVVVCSTHDGADNAFNELIEEIRAGKRAGVILRHTFADALAAGLYQRICYVRGKEWSADGERDWEAEVRSFYADDAEEELDVIPRAGTGVWLSRAAIRACMNPHYKVVYRAFEPGFELKPDHVRQAEVAAWLEDEIAPLLAALDGQALSYFGGDFGRSGDLTVFWPGQLDRQSQRLRVPFTIELRNCPFREQEQILNYVCDGLPNFVHGDLDARGIGAALAEFALQRYGEERITCVAATVSWYREQMPGFKARFEDATIEVPLDEDVIGDLRLVRLVKGVAQVPENKRTRSVRGGERHGDSAIAGVMLHAATQAEPISYSGYRSAGRREGEGFAPPDPLRRQRDRDGPSSAIGGMRGAW